MKLRYIYKRYIPDFFYNVKYGIKNIIRWVPAIWYDRDYDHSTIYNVLGFKLKCLEDFQEKHGICVSHKKIAKQIRICRILLNRLYKDDYFENALIPHERKWGKMSITFKPVNSDWSEMGSKYEDVKTEKDQELADKEFHRAAKHAGKMEDQDLDMLFKNIRKYIRGWWD